MIIFIMDSSADYILDQFIYCLVCECGQITQS